jgi:phosphoribosylcarboxyaminoimidazole (NCAIR) mutase
LDGEAPFGDADVTPDVAHGIDGGLADGLALDGGAARTLSGAVTDLTGLPVVGAKVASGSLSVFSDGQGLYTLAPVDSGLVVVTASRDWFKPFQV